MRDTVIEVLPEITIRLTEAQIRRNQIMLEPHQTIWIEFKCASCFPILQPGRPAVMRRRPSEARNNSFRPLFPSEARNN